MPKSPFFQKSFVPFNPWIYFFIFTATNSALSYLPLSSHVKIWIGMGGLLLPLVIAFKTYVRPTNTHSIIFSGEIFPSVHPLVWGALGVLAFFIRFYHLTSLSVWPHFDESMDNYLSFRLSQNWDWRLFYTYNQTTPAYFWVTGLILKFFPPSLGVLWLVPAVFSLLTVPASYLAARQFFSKSFSFLCVLLMSASFWPFYIGRFSFKPVFVLLWEYIVIFLWGRFLNEPLPGNRKWSLILFGAGMGFGFYIYQPPWILVFSFLTVTHLYHHFNQAPHRRISILFFGLPVILLCLPLLIESIRLGYGNYLHDLWALSPGNSLKDQSSTFSSYFSCLFWELPQFSGYSPFWGGLLNPFIGSWFLLGALEILKNLKVISYKWLALSLIFFFLPSVFSRSIEPFRLIYILPFLVTVTAIGVARLFTQNSLTKSTWLFLILFVFSFGLDFYHLTVQYHKVWNNPENWRLSLKSIERSRAYEILRKIAVKKGPGIILSDFVPGNCDPSLTLADFSFNAGENPVLSPGQAQWVALLVNIHYEPFLARQIPGTHTFALSKDLSGGDGGLMLWTAPLLPQNRGIVERWLRASRSLRPFIDQSLSYVHGKSFQPVLDSLTRVYPIFQGDRFLESVFWEKMADSFMRAGGNNHQAAIQALQQAIQRGYPAAHLYYDLGAYYSMDHQPNMAHLSFQRATQAPFDFTGSKQMLGKNQ